MPHGVGKAVYTQGIRAGDDQKIFAAAGIHGGFYFGHHVLGIDHRLAAHMAAALRPLLILDMNGRGVRPLEFPNGTNHVHGVAVSRIGIRDQGDIHGIGHAGGVFDHLGEGDETQIRQPETGYRRAVSGHIHSGETVGRNDLCRQCIVGTGGHDEFWLLDKLF